MNFKVTKKEIVEQLKQNMPEFTGTEEEIELKKALYIYVELGKIKSFDEKYYFGNRQTMKKIYNLSKKNERNIEEIAKQKKLICVSLTHLYCNVLKEFGISAVASTPEEGGHIYPIIMTKSGKVIKADLQLDLENIQTKSRLEYFEYMNDKDENQKAITEMLIGMGYISDEKKYKDEEIERLKEQVKNMNPHEALATIINDEQLYSGNEEMEGVEVSKFYIKVLKKIVPHFLNRKIYAFNCYKTKEKDVKDYTLCVFSEEHNLKPYLFSKKERKFLSVDIDKLYEFQREGLVLGALHKENGVNKLRKYMEKQTKDKENVK